MLAGDDQEDVFEEHPGSVLDPAPRTGCGHAEHAFGPQGAAQEMVGGDHDGRRNQHGPIAVKGDECERAKDIKMGLDPSAAQMNEQRPEEHLADGDDMASQELPGANKAR